MSTCLMLIDPQNSFCEVLSPEDQKKLRSGELCVPNAWEDMKNLAAMVKQAPMSIDDWVTTLDSHYRLHIAHPTFWKSVSDGSVPAPFTIMKLENGKIMGYNAITNDCVGEYTTVIPNFLEWTDQSGERKGAIPYLEKLQASGRYPLCVWTEHCIIGTRGHNIVEPILDAMDVWEDAHRNAGGAAYVQRVTKGSFLFSEHYGAVKAEVPDPDEPSTQLNADFIDNLTRHDTILLAGEALSHCLANTVRDIDSNTSDDDYIKKCILLTDCTSSVTGFEQLGEDFVNDMCAKGMQAMTSTEYLATLNSRLVGV